MSDEEQTPSKLEELKKQAIREGELEEERQKTDATKLQEEEKERLVKDLGEKKLMILRNHGTLALGGNVAEAFTSIYFLEKACTYQVRAMACKLELNDPSDAAKETTRQQGDGSTSLAAALVWPAIRRKMEKIDPSFMN